VELHGGDVTVDSTPGTGTTVSFTIPVPPPVLEPGPEPFSRLPIAAMSDRPLPLVLLVTDASSRQATGEELVRAGTDIVYAADHIKVRYLARELRPSALVIAGDVATEEARRSFDALAADERTHGTPVVWLTEDRATAAEFEAAGAVVRVVSPAATPADISDTPRTLLARHEPAPSDP
jgi:hypothetical protein